MEIKAYKSPQYKICKKHKHNGEWISLLGFKYWKCDVCNIITRSKRIW